MRHFFINYLCDNPLGMRMICGVQDPRDNSTRTQQYTDADGLSNVGANVVPYAGYYWKWSPSTTQDQALSDINQMLFNRHSGWNDPSLTGMIRVYATFMNNKNFFRVCKGRRSSADRVSAVNIVILLQNNWRGVYSCYYTSACSANQSSISYLTLCDSLLIACCRMCGCS